MTPLTVALVAPTMELLGGNTIQAYALAQALRAEGCEVAFVPINPRFPRGVSWLRRYRYVRTVVNEALYVPTLLRIRGANVTHIVSAAGSSFIVASLPAILAARMLGTRVVLHYHSGKGPDHLARWGPLVHPWLRLVDEIVVPSEYLRSVFAQHGYRVRVIRNIIDTAQFAYRERRTLRPRLLSTRALEPLYRVDNTLEAFFRVQARFPNATLTLAGYGTEEGRLRRLAALSGTDGVRFVGRIEPEAMPRLLNEADVFVNSSVIDNQPVSVLEAFAAGLPVVSTNPGDLAALVRNGETGLVVPPEDPGAMADAVTRLLNDIEYAMTLSQRARHEVERYTWPHVRHEWAAAYAGNGRAGGGLGSPPA